jgi:hypothetical protein
VDRQPDTGDVDAAGLRAQALASPTWTSFTVTLVVSPSFLMSILSP